MFRKNIFKETLVRLFEACNISSNEYVFVFDNMMLEDIVCILNTSEWNNGRDNNSTINILKSTLREGFELKSRFLFISVNKNTIIITMKEPQML